MTTKKETSEDKLWADLEEIRSSMAIEGFAVSDDELHEIKRRCNNNATVRSLPELKEQAAKEGRTLADVLNERLGLNIAFHSDDDI